MSLREKSHLVFQDTQDRTSPSSHRLSQFIGVTHFLLSLLGSHLLLATKCLFLDKLMELWSYKQNLKTYNQELSKRIKEKDIVPTVKRISLVGVSLVRLDI